MSSLTTATRMTLSRTLPMLSRMVITRGFHTRPNAGSYKPDNNDREVQELMNTVLDKLEKLDVRLGKLEEAKPKGRITVGYPGNKSFDPEKIMSFEVWKRTVYLTYPYALKLEYDKESTDWIVGGQNLMVPITSHTTTYRYKYKNKQEVDEAVQKILEACPRLRDKQ